MGTTIQDTRAAIATAITNAGLTCSKYQEDTIPTQLPAADLFLTGFEPAVMDQKVGFGTLAFTLTIYQHSGPRAQKAQEYMDAHLHTVMGALGADPTLTHKIRSWAFDSGRVYAARVEGSGSAMIVCEFNITVTPHPNAA